MQPSHPSETLFAPLTPFCEDGPGTPTDPRTEPLSRTDGEEQTPLRPTTDTPRAYVCPGEKHAIPRSIHLARLAAFYPNCRHCEHRHDTGQLPRAMIGRLEQSARRVDPIPLFRDEGVRGQYVNQLTRKPAGHIAEAVAARLWANRPLTGRPPSSAESEFPQTSRRAGGPTVLLGHDSRTSSPDISVGVSASLRRMGCDVVDVGRVSRPCLTFAVEHLQADAGIYVTGSGHPEPWTGLDTVGDGGLPWSMNGTLIEIERLHQQVIPRPTRQGGSQRYFDAAHPYRASLLKHYQELQPQRIICGCSETTVFETLLPMFENLPCILIPQELPRLAGCAHGRAAIPDGMMRDAIRSANADRGVVIADDGGALQLIGKDGTAVGSADVLGRLLATLALGRDQRKVAVGPDVDEDCRRVLSAHGWEIEAAGAGAEAMARHMRSGGFPLGVQASGRFWFRDTFPRCDAAVSLGRLLQASHLP